MSEQETPQQMAQHHHSRRHRRHKKSATPSWIVRYGIDILCILSFVIAILMLLNFFVREASHEWHYTPLGQWLLFQGGLRSFGAFVLVVTILLGSLRLRWRINQHKSWWAKSCPQCGSTHLNRIHRTPFDRLLGRVGIPVRRYICRECHWQGRRIDERHV